MRPLTGIKVLELGMVMQVPLAAQMLADLGADVIKVERPPNGDIVRDLDEVATADGGMSCYYSAVGRNKKSVGLDIKSERGREILLRLVRDADVLIHNFRPGVMERIGLGSDTVLGINSRIVYAASTAFGTEGPLAALPGQDMLAQALSGFAMAGVESGAAPRLTSVPVIDYTAAVHLTQAILAALFERERSGKGDVVTTSLYEVAIATQVLEISSKSLYDYETAWAQYAMPFRASDGWLLILTLFRPNPLKLMCEAFGLEDYSARPEFADAALQRKNRRLIEEKFAPIISQHTVADCMERLRRTDILAAPVFDIEQAMNHEQTAVNGTIWTVDVPGLGKSRLAGLPVKFARHELDQNPSPPSALGGDNDAVLSDLGFSQEEIAALRADGVTFDKKGGRT
jgi:crotonobetainyl-CoA:carnitine CoA-transferase CaiB-like acyl-CoA transferase